MEADFPQLLAARARTRAGFRQTADSLTRKRIDKEQRRRRQAAQKKQRPRSREASPTDFEPLAIRMGGARVTLTQSPPIPVPTPREAFL